MCLIKVPYFIKIPEDGVYQFFTSSDDGSQLFVENKLVVDNDGLHDVREEKGVLPLEAGFHPIAVTFFERADIVSLAIIFLA